MKNQKEKQLIESIKAKSKRINVSKLKEFDIYHISKEKYKNPINIDKLKYKDLEIKGTKNWCPLIIDNDNYVLDGYHRLALAKYKHKRKTIMVVRSKELTKKESNYIRNGVY